MLFNSDMPYILVTTQIRLEAGPCIVGDEHSDQELMKYLEAELKQENGQFFKVESVENICQSTSTCPPLHIAGVDYFHATQTSSGQAGAAWLHCDTDHRSVKHKKI